MARALDPTGTSGSPKPKKRRAGAVPGAGEASAVPSAIWTPPKLWPHEPIAEDGFCAVPTPPDPWGWGQRACDAAARFTIAEGRLAGQPFRLAPYQQRTIAAIFGHVDPTSTPEAPRRMVRTVTMVLARKSGKTNFLALVACLLVASEREPSQLILIAAPTISQSRVAYAAVVQLIGSYPALAARSRVRDHLSTVEVSGTRGGTHTIRCIAVQSPEAAHGYGASAVFADEIHGWSAVLGIEKAQRAYSALTSGMGARVAPLVMRTTTVPDDAATLERGTLFSDVLAQAQAVAAGKQDDPHHWPVLYLTPQEADWHDEQVWRRANPGLGLGIQDIEELRLAHQEATNNAATERAFKCLRLNMLPTASATSGRWFTSEKIERMRADVTLQDVAECEVRAIGLDLAVVDDIAAVCWAGLDHDDVLCAGAFGFIAGDAFDTYVREAPEMAEMVEAGDLVVVRGDGVDLEQVAEDVIGLAEKLGAPTIALDPAKAVVVTQQLEDAGLDVAVVRQSAFHLQPAVITVEKYAALGRIRLAGKLLPWCMGNAVVRRLGAAHTIEAAQAARNPKKIDAAAALLDAVSALITMEQDNASEDAQWQINAWLHPTVLDAQKRGARYVEQLLWYVNSASDCSVQGVSLHIAETSSAADLASVSPDPKKAHRIRLVGAREWPQWKAMAHAEWAALVASQPRQAHLGGLTRDHRGVVLFAWVQLDGQWGIHSAPIAKPAHVHLLGLLPQEQALRARAWGPELAAAGVDLA